MIPQGKERRLDMPPRSAGILTAWFRHAGRRGSRVLAAGYPRVAWVWTAAGEQERSDAGGTRAALPGKPPVHSRRHVLRTRGGHAALRGALVQLPALLASP